MERIWLSVVITFRTYDFQYLWLSVHLTFCTYDFQNLWLSVLMTFRTFDYWYWWVFMTFGTDDFWCIWPSVLTIFSTKTVSRFHSPLIVDKYKLLQQAREQLLIETNKAWIHFLKYVLSTPLFVSPVIADRHIKFLLYSGSFQLSPTSTRNLMYVITLKVLVLLA